MKISALLSLGVLPFLSVYAQRTSSTTRTTTRTTTTATTLSTSTTTTTTSAAATSSAAQLLSNVQVNSDILVIARDADSAKSAYSGLNGYGIPYQVLLVPQGGTQLPALTSSTGGNFGGIIIAGQVAYDYGGTLGFQSALSTAQWNQLYAYQISYGVRMVQYDVYPGPNFGASALGACCDTGVEQLISFSNTAAFSQAGIKTGAGMSTQGLYHYPAKVTDGNTTEIAQFAANSQFSTVSTAGVINNWGGRQQMAFFIGWATDWSPTSNFLQHAYITWMTRGLYAGYRRVNLNTQIDDMFLSTGIYYPGNYEYRVTTTDMTRVANWVPTIQNKMNPGSYYRPEIGHNGNGNILYAANSTNGAAACGVGPVDTGDYLDTPLEFQKPLGTGTNAWPSTLSSYPYTTSCVNRDPLKVFFSIAGYRDRFMHLTHTFTHYELNNATYSDALKEIQWNQAWFQQVSIAAGSFTPNGLIPPAITGIHNGDVLQAWTDAGLTNCVGDNTRPPLRNQQNPMYAYTTTMANNGFDGFQVIPRWATRIYYNCDTADCTTKEWIDTSAGVGGFTDLMNQEKADTMRHLFGLYREGYMFHQANLRGTGVSAIPINGSNQQISIFQGWVETIVAEFNRLVNWPMITLKQSDLAIAFADRQTRDNCNYGMSYSIVNGKIVSVGVNADGNSCSANIPLTAPNGAITNFRGFSTERIGNDPTTVWVRLSGAQQTFTLAAPITI